MTESKSRFLRSTARVWAEGSPDIEATRRATVCVGVTCLIEEPVADAATVSDSGRSFAEPPIASGA